MLDYGKQELILGAIVDIIAAMNNHIEKVTFTRDKETGEFDIVINIDHCPNCEDE